MAAAPLLARTPPMAAPPPGTLSRTRQAAAASGAPADAARARRLFVTLHGYTRVVLAVNPLVGAQLRSINLDTLRREAPPAGYWARVLRRAGLIGALGRFPAPALAELRERLRLHRASMVRARGARRGRGPRPRVSGALAEALGSRQAGAAGGTGPGIRRLAPRPRARRPRTEQPRTWRPAPILAGQAAEGAEGAGGGDGGAGRGAAPRRGRA